MRTLVLLAALACLTACRRAPGDDAAQRMGDLLSRAALAANNCFVDYLAKSGASALEYRFGVKDHAYVYKDLRVEPANVPQDRIDATEACLKVALAKEKIDHPDVDELSVRVDAKPK